MKNPGVIYIKIVKLTNNQLKPNNTIENNEYKMRI